MKKLSLFFLLSCFVFSAMAQENETEATVAKPVKNIRKKFFNISYLSEKFKEGDISFDGMFDEAGDVANDNTKGLKNNYGVSLTRGRTYGLHKKPIARLITIGIDASFFYVSYSNYTMDFGFSEDFKDKLEEHDYDISDKFDLHKIDYSFQVGPSVTITPGKKLTVAVYARYAPTFSMLVAEGSFNGNYASLFTTGASVAYGRMGVGVEARMGSCKYKNFSGDLDIFSGSKFKTSGFRAYLQFRW